jgi:competence protein ComEA
MGALPEGVETGAAPSIRRRQPTIPGADMKKILLVLKSLALTAAFAGLAHAGGTIEKVNINSADAATLDRVLDGVGPSKAEAIVAYRKSNGAFRSIEQLASVKGIGLSTVERNRERILVGGGAAPAAKAAPAKPAAPARPAAKR